MLFKCEFCDVDEMFFMIWVVRVDGGGVLWGSVLLLNLCCVDWVVLLCELGVILFWYGVVVIRLKVSDLRWDFGVLVFR